MCGSAGSTEVTKYRGDFHGTVGSSRSIALAMTMKITPAAAPKRICHTPLYHCCVKRTSKSAGKMCGSAGTTEVTHQSGDFHGIVGSSRSIALSLRMKKTCASAQKQIPHKLLYRHCTIGTSKMARKMCSRTETTEVTNQCCDFHGIVGSSRSIALSLRMKTSSACARKWIPRKLSYRHCAMRTLKSARKMWGSAGSIEVTK